MVDFNKLLRDRSGPGAPRERQVIRPDDVQRIEGDEFFGDALPALPASPLWGRIESVDEEMGSDAAVYPKVPYLGFYTERMRGKKAAVLFGQCGEVQGGQPFICNDGVYDLVDEHRIILLKSFKFYGRFDFGNKGRVTHAWESGEEPEDKGRRPNRIAEAHICVLVHIAPNEGERCYLSLSRFLDAQGRFVRSLGRGVTVASKPGFATVAERTMPGMAQVVMSPNFNPRFRNPGSLLTSVEPGNEGFDFVKADARCAVITPNEARRVIEFLSDAKTEAALSEMFDAFDMRRDEVLKIAAKQRNAGPPDADSPDAGSARSGAPSGDAKRSAPQVSIEDF